MSLKKKVTYAPNGESPNKSYFVFSNANGAALTSSRFPFSDKLSLSAPCKVGPSSCVQYQPLLYSKIVALSAVGLFIYTFTRPLPPSCHEGKDLTSDCEELSS